MYIKREIEKILDTTSKQFKVIYLGGPRQVGKTTVLQRLAQAKEINYVTLDDFALRRLASSDPKLFLAQNSTPLIIDEIQYAPELFPEIKLIVDKKEDTGQYWLTGSQHFSIIKGLRETLSGRVAILTLLGLSQREINQKIQESPFLPSNIQKMQSVEIDPIDIFSIIQNGAYPALYSKNNKPNLDIFYNSYIQTYIDRDITQMYGIEKIMEYHKLLQVCAGRSGQLLNMSDISKDIGVSVSTIKDWLSILEQTMQIYLLKPHSNNLNQREIKLPKLYFLDTGLASYLTKWKTPETLMNGHYAGAYFETFVISEIIKSYLNHGIEPPLYYFRDKEKHEIDLIIEKNGIIYPIEIKLASTIKNNHISNIKYYKKITGNRNIADSTVICLSDRIYKFNEFVNIFPANQI